MEIQELLSNPSPYYGQPLIVRGYLIVQDVETTALLEPKHRQSHILINIRKLPAETAEQLLACRLKLVDVQGYVTHIPTRGGDAPIIFAEAMVGVLHARDSSSNYSNDR